MHLMVGFWLDPLHVCDAEVLLASSAFSVHMAINFYTRDGSRIFAVPSSSMICIYVDRVIANLVKSCMLSSILPRRDLRARRLASIADTCLTEILRSRVCPHTKDVLLDFRNTALVLPHVSYTRISLPEGSMSQHGQYSGYAFYSVL